MLTRLPSTFDRTDAGVVAINDRVAFGHVVDHCHIAVRASNQTLQQTTVFAWQPISTVEAVIPQLCLHPLEHFFVDDCLMPAGMEIGLVFEFSTVDRIGQQGVDTAFIEQVTAFRNPLL